MVPLHENQNLLLGISRHKYFNKLVIAVNPTIQPENSNINKKTKEKTIEAPTAVLF